METGSVQRPRVSAVIISMVCIAFALSITDHASGSPQTGGSPLTLSATSLSFGNVAERDPTGSKTIILSNVNPMAQNITISLSNPDYTETDTCQGSVAAAGSCTISVKLTPSAMGPDNGTLSVTDTALSISLTATLTATSVLPAILSDTSLNFGNVAEKSPSTTYKIYFYNTEAVALNISISLSNPDYTETDTCKGSVAAMNNCLISVTFTPSVLGPDNGTLSVTDTAWNNPQTATLTGTGALPLTLSATSLSFGNVAEKDPTGSKTITLSNNEAVAQNISIGLSNPDYSETDTCQGSVAAHGNCTISVKLTPSALGPDNGALSVTDTALNISLTATLTGTSVLPAILSATSLSFGNVAEKSPSTSYKITFYNTEAVAQNISIGLSNPDYTETDTCKGVVAAQGNCIISVTLTPSAPGPDNGTLSVTDTAWNNPQTATLTGTGVVPLSLSATSLSFGNVAEKDPTGSKTITLSNNEAVAQNISISLSNPDYTETDTCKGSVAARGNCTISVKLTPSAMGPDNGALSVTDTALNISLTATLTATSVLPAILSDTSLSFGNVAEKSPSTSYKITFYNTEAVALNISIGLSNPDYTETDTCKGSVAAMSNCLISVTFTPSVMGPDNGTLSVTDTAWNNPQTATLTGTGALPLTLSATSLSFGNVAEKDPTGSKTITLSNNEAVAQNISIGLSNHDYTETDTCQGSVAAHGNCTISVKLTPSAMGPDNGTLSVTDSALNISLTASLTATSVLPAILSASSLSFGKVDKNSPSTSYKITFYNTEAVALNISIGLSNPDYTETDTCKGVVAAQGNCIISVTLTPSAPGPDNGTLSVTDTAWNSPQTASLSGTATAPIDGFSSTSLVFDNQTVGTTSTPQTLTLSNTGDGALNITNLALTGANPGDFAQNNNCGASVAAGSGCTISVTFAPAAMGTRAASLSITDNAGGSPQTVSLSGSGNPPVISGISVTTGPAAGGTSFILTGSGFEQGATVSFGSTPATSVSVLGSTQIQAETPPVSAGTVSVTVTNPDGGTVALPNGFTFDNSSFWQFLDRFLTGIARNATKPYALLQRGPGIYQPDILIFHDTTTGTEVWRLDNDPSNTWLPGILNRTPWNMNGSWIGLASNRCILEVYCGNGHQYLYDGRGGLQRLITPTDPTRSPSWTQLLEAIDTAVYLPWDRFNPNVAYIPTWNDTNQGFWANPLSILYAVDVSNQDTATMILDLPNPTLTKEIQSYLSEDNVLMARDADPGLDSNGNPLYIPEIYMVDMNSTRATYGTMLYQYGINFGLTAPGHSQSNEYQIHDIYFRRNSTDTHIMNYGPQDNVGESVWFEVPLDGNPAQVNLAFPNATDSTPYYSHPAWNYTGTLVAYNGEKVLNDHIYGSWVRNHDLQQTLAQIGDAYAGHFGWDGYDPAFVTFDDYTPGGMQQLMDANPSGSGTRALVNYGPSNPNNLSNLYGPTQSPDATKVAFTIPDNWTSSTSKFHTYTTVSHRPFPPVLAAGSTSPVTLQWTPYLTSREVKGYHVYRSPDGRTSFQEISNGLASGASFVDNTANAGQTYFYAVTAEEYSGLESSQLSNIMQVTAGGASSQFAQAGATGWDTVAPAPPTNVGLSNLAAGVWKLTWTASASSNTRYYNIFYNAGSAPPPTQPFAVDSPPVYETSYIYWQADPSTTPEFGIQAVDRQGNQSSMVCVAGTTPPGPCF